MFLPETMMIKLNLIVFKADYGKYFGISFIGSSGLLILMLGKWIINKVNSKISNAKYRKIILESVQNLDNHEKAVLREFYIQDKNTLKIPMDNPTVSGLVNKHILYLVGQYGEMSVVGMLFNYSISNVARENLTYELLELPIGEPSKQEIEQIRINRPSWMLKLESKQRIFDSLY